MKHVKQYENFLMDTWNMLDSNPVVGIILGSALGNFLHKITKYFQDNYVIKKVYNKLQSDENLEVKEEENKLIINVNNEYLLIVNKITKKLNITKLPIKKFYLGHRKTEVELSDEDYQNLLSIMNYNNIKG